MFFEFDFKDNDDALYFRFEKGMYKFIPVKVVGRDGVGYKIEIDFESHRRFYVDCACLIHPKQLEDAKLNELEFMLLSKALFKMRNDNDVIRVSNKPKKMIQELNRTLVHPQPLFSLTESEINFQSKVELFAMKIIYLLKNYIKDYLNIEESGIEQEKEFNEIYNNIEKILKINDGE